MGCASGKVLVESGGGAFFLLVAKYSIGRNWRWGIGCASGKVLVETGGGAFVALVAKYW